MKAFSDGNSWFIFISQTLSSYIINLSTEKKKKIEQIFSLMTENLLMLFGYA